MATFVFENMTQAQADALAATDIIAFATTTVNARNVGVANSTQLGTDTITLTVGAKSLNFNAATLSAISNADQIAFNDNSGLLLGTQGADTNASFTGSANPNTVYLFAGNDSITQAGVNTEDFIYGMGGNDTIVGGSTASHLYGFNASGGTDGTDSITGGAAGDYIQGNAGNDTLAGAAGSDRLLGGAGNDTISGGADQDTVNGNTGNDTIDGGTENDFLRGGQGNDDLRGDAGADTLLGDLGTDTITGGAGVDLLSGGGGNDVFAFAAADAAPVTPVGSNVTQYEAVADFTNGEDQFQIRGSGASSGTTFGATAADVVRGSSDAVFSTVTAATTYAQQLLDANASSSDVAAVKVGNDVYLFWGSAEIGKHTS